MKLKALLIVLIPFLCLLTACNKSTAAFSDSQKKEIDQEIQTYLTVHPEILIEMSKKLQDNMAKEQSQKGAAAVKEHSSALLNDSTSPTVGNKAASVTMIEFFDYQCVHCQKMHPVTQELLKTNSDVKVIYKELPIFGKVSEYAAVAALAANKQGKYVEMRNALFHASGDAQLTEARVDALAKKVGLNIVEMKKDMKSAEIQGELKRTRDLAQKLGLQGTPAFVVIPSESKNLIDEKIAFIPGGAPIEVLQDAVNKAK